MYLPCCTCMHCVGGKKKKKKKLRGEQKKRKKERKYVRIKIVKTILERGISMKFIFYVLQMSTQNFIRNPF